MYCLYRLSQRSGGDAVNTWLLEPSNIRSPPPLAALISLVSARLRCSN